MPTNYRQLYAMKRKNELRILKLNPKINHQPGIYFFLRKSEQNENEIYIGQAVDLLRRCADHLTGYQYIDLSIKAHGLYASDNPHGYRLEFLHIPKGQLDEMEQFYIKKYSENGWILKNKTAGGQGKGKQKISEYKPSKGYRDGIEAGYKKASKEIAHLFDLHLTCKTQKEPPTKNQIKAMDKFKEFLEYHLNH